MRWNFILLSENFKAFSKYLQTFASKVNEYNSLELVHKRIIRVCFRNIYYNVHLRTKYHTVFQSHESECQF